MTEKQQLARRAPHRMAADLSPADLHGWSDDIVAGLICWLPLDHPVSDWAERHGKGLWRLARWVADRDRGPRDWAPALERTLARVASEFESPLPEEATDLLADSFHLDHRHTTSSRLAWVDPTTWPLAEVKRLAKHPAADARVQGRVVARLEALYHRGPEVSDSDLARASAKAKQAKLGPPPAPAPGALADSIEILLGADDEAARVMLERTTIESVFRRYLAIPTLNDAERKATWLKIVRLGFGWQRGLALGHLLASSRATDEDLTNAAARGREDEARELLARPELPPHALREIWRRFEGLQHQVVQHPRAPRELLEARSDFVLAIALKHTADEAWLASKADELAGSEHSFAVIDNSRCPPEILTKAQASPVAYVRATVALHPRTSSGILAVLATDPDESVRSSVAENAQTPGDVLDSLSHDASSAVRHHVACHPSARTRTLERLAEDPKPKVRSTASKHLQAARLAEGALPTSVLEAASGKVRRSVAWRTHIAREVQAALVRDKDVKVRVEVAGNPGLEGAFLRTLAQDEHPSVRRAVAHHPRTPPDILSRLACEPRRWISNPAKDRLPRQ